MAAEPQRAPSVSVIIPTHSRRDALAACLDSIRAGTRQPAEIIVVDNASTDGTVDMLRDRFPEIRVLCNDTNRFATIARNQGMKEATGDYLLLVDDDNEVDPRMIEELVNFCEADPTIGMAGPKMYYHGTEKRLLFMGARIHPVTARTVYRGVGEIDQGQYGEPADTEHIPNIMMLRRSACEAAGGFDERYRMTYSEADLPMRLREKGLKVRVCPTAITHHKADLPEAGAARASSFKTPMRAYYLARNRVLYMKRFSGTFQFVIFFLVFRPLYTIFYALEARRTGNPESLRMHLKGCWHGWLYGVTGRLLDAYGTGG